MLRKVIGLIILLDVVAVIYVTQVKLVHSATIDLLWTAFAIVILFITASLLLSRCLRESADKKISTKKCLTSNACCVLIAEIISASTLYAVYSDIHGMMYRDVLLACLSLLVVLIPALYIAVALKR